jgi:hypothetical protein
MQQQMILLGKNETGASIRDLSRGLGIGRSIIERAVKI